MVRSFYQLFLNTLQTEAVVLATVIEVSGSTPREIGAKMFVNAAGKIQGTIGGGAGEAKVIQHALQVLETGVKQRVEIDLSGHLKAANPISPKEGICGGRMGVWLERWAGNEARAIVQEILTALEAGRSITLVTPYGSERSPWIVDQFDPPKSPFKRGTLSSINPVPLLRGARGDQNCEGDEIDRTCGFASHGEGDDPPKSPFKRGTLINNNLVPPLFLALAARSAGARGDQNCKGEALDAFVEVIQPQPTVLIIGAGHCGIQLAKVADIAGFQVMVQDDRRDWANADHYPQATRIFTTSIEETIAQLNYHAALYIALLTRGYQHDVQALQAIMTKAIPCRYIGMMGSQRRVQQVLQAVQAKVAQEFSELSELQISQWLQHIHAPIGLDIGALTPEEIAISITAEMIQIRHRDRDQKCSP
ncbi:MAG: hypothetical protein B0A82_13540 [Alkalinema sp. CACIAM 70d]|nr:MAG: hypothetical protein B0A82_13540 [Alkalinema sp. CACIAM 70d]